MNGTKVNNIMYKFKLAEDAVERLLKTYFLPL